MSSVVASRKFPWQVVRGPFSLIAAYVVGYNIANGVDKNQWWFPLALAAVALLTVMLEGVYDEPLPGDGLGPLDMSNVTCMLLGLAVPIAAVLGGAFHDDWYWWAGALAVFLMNMVIYFGFRQRGLSGTVVVVCLLALAIF